MTEKISKEAEAKKRCCEQSFLASVAGLNKDNQQEPGPFRRVIGFLLLAAVHLHMIMWSALVSTFKPRYRSIVVFQARYFRDVMSKELRSSRLPEAVDSGVSDGLDLPETGKER